MIYCVFWCSWRLYGDRGSHLLLVEGVFLVVGELVGGKLAGTAKRWAGDSFLPCDAGCDHSPARACHPQQCKASRAALCRCTLLGDMCDDCCIVIL